MNFLKSGLLIMASGNGTEGFILVKLMVRITNTILIHFLHAQSISVTLFAYHIT